MRAVIATLLLASVCSAPMGARAADRSSTDANMTAVFQQLTQKWEDAVQARDLDTIGRIEADDWRSIGSGGKVWTKQMDMDSIRSATSKHMRAELGPLDVKMLSDTVAVAQGTLTDKNTGSAYAYMDVWEKRGNNWVVVRSLSTKLN